MVDGIKVCRPLAVGAAAVLGLASAASAIEIDGVGNGSLDQPRVNAILRIQPTAGQASTEDPLGGDVSDLEDLFNDLGLDPALFGLSATNIDAYYDTGAGVGLIGGYTATNYGVPVQPTASFTDVGVGGSETFDVSQRLTVQIASSSPGLDLNNLSNYQHTFTDVHAAVGEVPGGGLESQDPVDQVLEDLIGSLYDFNVLGMPFFENKVVVMDARALNGFVTGGGEVSLNSVPQLFTHVYDKNDPTPPAWNPVNAANPGIPDASEIDITIELEFADFSGLTSTQNGTPPTLAHNPMIGGGLPTHLNETVDGRDATEGVTITRGASSSTGSWLFDTGAAATIISLEQAEALGIRYRAGSEPSEAGPVLLETTDGVALSPDDQFTLQLGGVGGTLTVAGFFLDSLTLPGLQDDLTFLNAPVLVADIAVADPLSPGGEFVLDGIFGMNFLFASTFIDGQIDVLGGLGDLALIPGAFDFVVYDEAENRLHLSYATGIPEPGTVLMLAAGASLFMLRRRG